MSSPLVLITGATGFIGFKVFLDALNKGYHTRLAIRSEAKKNAVLSNPDFKALKAEDRVSFIVVPDLAVPGAYDEAVKGVDYIIHVASSITDGGDRTQEEYHEFFIKPAISGTVGILDSAEKEPKVKRVVITSSAVANRSFLGLIGQDDHHVSFAEDRTPDDEGPYLNEFHAYAASKIAALNATDKWIAEHKPKFDLVNVHPGFVEGRDALALEAPKAISGTNGVLLRIVTGNVGETPLPGVTVHLNDVAKIHVESLDTKKIPAGSYSAIWNPEGTTLGSDWGDVSGYAAKLFPDAVKKGILTIGEKQGSIQINFDSSNTEKVFGWKFEDLESQVKSVVGHYIELASKA